MNRKLTAWKKNQDFGDIAGGRRRLKCEDNVLQREHTFKAPSPEEEIPILIQENPSRDFYFPISVIEARDYLKTFPLNDVEGVTHIWLKRLKSSDYKLPDRPLAEYIWGSGVYLIVIYPWARNGLLPFGYHRPSAKVLRYYKRWTTDLKENRGTWYLKWTREAVRDFYLTGLLAHEIGHHCDPKRPSPANKKHREETAEQYSLRWMPNGQKLFSIENPV